MCMSAEWIPTPRVDQIKSDPLRRPFSARHARYMQDTGRTAASPRLPRPRRDLESGWQLRSGCWTRSTPAMGTPLPVSAAQARYVHLGFHGELEIRAGQMQPTSAPGRCSSCDAQESAASVIRIGLAARQDLLAKMVDSCARPEVDHRAPPE
jgi:hypothetical protein